jgi:hypothetical protein
MSGETEEHVFQIVERRDVHQLAALDEGIQGTSVTFTDSQTEILDRLGLSSTDDRTRIN